MNCKYAIHPAIGIARVGDSEEFYIGPERYASLPINLDGRPFTARDFRDQERRMKRQAARFTVYRIEEDGRSTPVQLGDGQVREIRWCAHLANKKAIWYEFAPLRGEHGYAPNHPLRNAHVTDPEARTAMIIDPGARMVRTPGERQHFDRASTPDADKRFPPRDIRPFTIDTLGTMEMDAKGRLLLVGGHGRAGALAGHESITHYANNDGWFDDTADGPVTATVVLHNGEEIEAAPAWVLVAPPAYAPEVPNLVTLFDTMFDVAVRKLHQRPDIYADGLWNHGPDGFLPHFETDIAPILQRGARYPWVVAIPPKPHAFDLSLLGDSSAAMRGMRRRILDYLRAPGDENTLIQPRSGATMMPYLAGDSAVGSVETTTSKYLRLTDTQYFMLEQWAEGHFTSGPDHAPSMSDGDALTRAVLENCVGGAFSPGIEMTWISRMPQIYEAPLRIRHRRDVGYPLRLGWEPEKGLEPGDVTKMMAIPWQADFNECSSEVVGDRTLWWWPAQRPLFVYQKRKPDAPPRASIWQAVQQGEIRQVPWVGSDYDMEASDFVSFSEDNEMVEKWQGLGFVINEGDDEHPWMIEVERVWKRED